jgi:hypothetical protein
MESPDGAEVGLRRVQALLPPEPPTIKAAEIGSSNPSSITSAPLRQDWESRSGKRSPPATALLAHPSAPSSMVDDAVDEHNRLEVVKRL